MLKSRTLKAPLSLALLAGVSSVVLVAGVLSVSTRTVQADTLLSRQAPTPPAATLAQSATPASLAPKEIAGLSKRHRLHGIASWYGGRFDGRQTASGEVYDMYAMTACHPTLPFGTIVRVTNRKNHRSVMVRIIDLSLGAAEQLDMVNSGLASVDLTVISLGKGRYIRG